MIDRNLRSSKSIVSDFPLSRKTDQSVLTSKERTIGDVADIYNRAGDDYAAYADGDPTQPFVFDGMHAFADRYLWTLLEEKLIDLRASGATSISILDAGCGPGTWLRRLVLRACALGFTSIKARGFDIAQVQIQRARFLSKSLSMLPGVDFTFEVADLTDRLPEADASVDMTLCLYSVLSHLPVAALANIAVELARVTSGHFITTVRPIGSPPTASSARSRRCGDCSRITSGTNARSNSMTAGRSLSASICFPQRSCADISHRTSTLKT